MDLFSRLGKVAEDVYGCIFDLTLLTAVLEALESRSGRPCSREFSGLNSRKGKALGYGLRCMEPHLVVS